ncbi:MAG: U32 family peptidase [Clostridiales bacterium]|jgi:putative protease|nr:U32 family peptidase [Clostridiales bacterium]
MPELLAPAGNLNKLYTAFHFGADAVYLGGNQFSLRAFADNFSIADIRTGTEFAHSIGKKVYVAVNVYPRTDDFGAIREYFSELKKIGVDGLIVGDMGVLTAAKDAANGIPIHLSTQANTTNAEAVKFYRVLGVKRGVLARDLTRDEIKEIRDGVDGIEIECFVHGAMCMSYSGRCILSNYLTGRDSNRGECAQPCRYEYRIREVSDDRELTLCEDKKGTYLLNSKDLCMIGHIGELESAGVGSFKIEGRMKSEFYVGSVVNAYRRALDDLSSGKNTPPETYFKEIEKTGNRGFTTGFYFGGKDYMNLESSKNRSEYIFAACVLGYDEGRGALIVEQRNRFIKGDRLQVLSNGENFLREIEVAEMSDLRGAIVTDAKRVQEVLYLKTDLRLEAQDILYKN